MAQRISKIVLTDGGVWDSSKTYPPYTYVRHNGDGWWSTRSTTASEPAKGNANWVQATDTQEFILKLKETTTQAQAITDSATQAEQLRVEAEQVRAAAENERNADENLRKLSETERLAEESKRQNAEKSRVAAEAVRDGRYNEAEENRNTVFQAAESERQTAEEARKQAEAARIQAENERDAAEQLREALTVETKAAAADAKSATEAANTAAGKANEAADKFNAAIVQETGDAQDKVISQHGVTEAINGLTNKVTELESEIITKGVINLTLFQTENIVPNLRPGEVGFNTTLNYLVEKLDEKNYRTITPSFDGMYIYDGDEYRWNGTTLVKWKPEISESIEANREDINTITQQITIANDAIKELVPLDIVVHFSKSYSIWKISDDNKVVESVSSYSNQRSEKIVVAENDEVTIEQSIGGQSKKAIFTDANTNVIKAFAHNEKVERYVVPQGVTQLYINRLEDTPFSLVVKKKETIPETIEKKVNTSVSTISKVIIPPSLSEPYLIWTLQGGKVIESNSSYPNRRILEYIKVEEGDALTIEQSIGGQSKKAIIADDNNNALCYVDHAQNAENLVVPRGGTRLYINSLDGTELKIEKLEASTRIVKKISLLNSSSPVYAPFPQQAAQGIEGTLSAETTTSDELFSACDAAIAGFPHYAKSELLGKDASGTYDIKRYILCKSDLFAWKANDVFYCWKSGSDSALYYVKSISPRVGDIIYNSQLEEYDVVGFFSSISDSMADSKENSYQRYSTKDLQADVIYTKAETSDGWPFDIFDNRGNRITKGASASTWSDTISYNGKIYTRHSPYDTFSGLKKTIVIWAQEHAMSSDPHECAIVMYRLIKDLCRGGASRNAFLNYLKNFCKVVILPVVNPYGMTRYALYSDKGGRANSKGVNINRNYPTKGWSAGEVGGPDYGGAYGGSEVETQYVINSCAEFGADVGIDIHALSYDTKANEGNCAYGVAADFSEKVKDVATDIRNDYEYNLNSYGDSNADGEGSGKNWLLANGIVGGLIEMNAGAYSSKYNEQQHTADVLELDYTLLLRMLNMWIVE